MIRGQDHNLEIELSSNSQNFQIWSMHSNDIFLYIFQFFFVMFNPMDHAK